MPCEHIPSVYEYNEDENPLSALVKAVRDTCSSSLNLNADTGEGDFLNFKESFHM